MGGADLFCGRNKRVKDCSLTLNPSADLFHCAVEVCPLFSGLLSPEHSCTY